MPTNVFAELWQLVRRAEMTVFNRACALVTAALLVVGGYEPLFSAHDDPAWAQPIFDGVRQFPLELWGAWFVFDAILMLLAATTARLVFYGLAVLCTSITLGGWALTILFTDLLVAGTEMTATAIMLYGLSAIGVLGVAWAPRPSTMERPIVTILDDESADPPVVTRLRRVAS